MNKRIKRLLCVLLVIITSICSIPSSSPQIIQAKTVCGAKESKVKKCYQFFLDKGFSEAACAGIVGNLLTETTGINEKYDDGVRVGIAQWMKDRYTNLKKRKGWNTLEGQLQFVYEELEKSHRGNFESTTFIGNTGMTYKKFKKKTEDPIKCAELVAVCYEGCYDTKKGLIGIAYVDTYQGIDKRRKYAKEVYELYSGKLVAGSTGTEEETTSSKVKDAVQSIVNDFESHTLDNFTKLPNMSDLTAEDRMDISKIQDGINKEIQEKESDYIRNIRVATLIFALILVVYSLLLFLSYWFDRFNNIFEIELLRIVSFGKYYAQVDNETTDGSAKALTMRGVILLLITGVLVAQFIMSGKMFSVLAWLVNLYNRMFG